MSPRRAVLLAGLLAGSLLTAAPVAQGTLAAQAGTATQGGTATQAGAAAKTGTAARATPATATLVTRSPFGLSIEYPLLERALGSGSCPGPALVATLKSLGSPTLRVGGDSQDLAGPTGAYHYV
ncbi:MAG TPA: hypothetical protein VK672_01375, partial [Solirubrobacteraceae bacterium]|nr:hypothetical protein [Solirubrobacteraceae bacterium]